jgi:adenosylhomocysteinase
MRGWHNWQMFFSRVIHLCPSHPQTDFVVVTHLLEDRPWFLKAVSQLGDVVAIIPKRKSIVPRVRDLLRLQYKMLDITRSELETEEGVKRHLGSVQRDLPLSILDIGGYFAPMVSMDTKAMGLRIAGIVEDTENWHVKYSRAIENGACNQQVYSVARSNLKSPENFLVGQSLVFSVEAILGQLDEVIGYGNIGRSVAQHLRERHVNVTVYDTDPIKLVEAFTHGFRTPETVKEAFADADVLFCATGNHSIGAAELSHLRPYTP